MAFKPTMDRVEVSIIILAKDAARYIGATLGKVFDQEIGQRYEVIVIDSGSRDSTPEIAERFPLRLLRIPPEEFGHGRTRNLGARVARGKIVAFLNADATPLDKYWLKNLVEGIETDAAIAGSYSRQQPRADCNPLRCWEILNAAGQIYEERRVKSIRDLDEYNCMSPKEKRILLAFETVSCAIRRHILLKYPFKDMGFGEDLEWSKRVLEAGCKIVFTPQSVVVHSHDFYRSFIQTLKKYFDDSQLNNRLLNMWPRRRFPVLLGCLAFKLYRDISYILGLKRGISYKVSWIFRSPVVRLAELAGTALACFMELPPRLQKRLSLASDITKAAGPNEGLR
jgi:rhamnosyltransferase